MAVCPICESVTNSVKVDKVIARLDRSISWTARYDELTCRVNAFKPGSFFDFEEVEIGICSLEEINTFCIQAGNDPSMSQRLKNVDIRLLPGVMLKDQARRNLKKVFRGKVESSRFQSSKFKVSSRLVQRLVRDPSFEPNLKF